MLFEWLAENIFSILILFAVLAVLAILVFRMYKEHKASAHSPTPGCCGCPHAKKCASSGAACSCSAVKEKSGEGDKTENP